MAKGEGAELVGSWKLMDYVVTDITGTVSRPLGPRPLGLLIYSADGYMAVQMTSRGPDRPGAPARRQPSLVAYSGRWLRRGGRIFHRPLVSTVPAWVGTTLERELRLEGRRLILETPARRAGARTIRARLTWVRIEPPARGAG